MCSPGRHVGFWVCWGECKLCSERLLSHTLSRCSPAPQRWTSALHLHPASFSYTKLNKTLPHTTRNLNYPCLLTDEMRICARTVCCWLAFVPFFCIRKQTLMLFKELKAKLKMADFYQLEPISKSALQISILTNRRFFTTTIFTV